MHIICDIWIIIRIFVMDININVMDILNFPNLKECAVYGFLPTVNRKVDFISFSKKSKTLVYEVEDKMYTVQGEFEKFVDPDTGMIWFRHEHFVHDGISVSLIFPFKDF